jgi:hypothetical protein
MLNLLIMPNGLTGASHSAVCANCKLCTDYPEQMDSELMKDCIINYNSTDYQLVSMTRQITEVLAITGVTVLPILSYLIFDVDIRIMFCLRKKGIIKSIGENRAINYQLYQL